MSSIVTPQENLGPWAVRLTTGTTARTGSPSNKVSEPWEDTEFTSTMASPAGGRHLVPRAASSRQLEIVGRLRLMAGVQILEDGDTLWLRGEELDDQQSRLLRSIPDAERFVVTTDGQLTNWNETVPCERLPAGDWQPLTHWLAVQLPTSAFAANVSRQIPLRLVRSEIPAEANWLRTTWSVWRDYATTAPQIRLNQWSFAVSDSQEVLIRGLPLPPIPGGRLVEQSGIALPAGLRFNPSLDSESIRQRLGVPENTLAVFRDEDQMEFVPESAFVRATRSAVRLTEASWRQLPS